ncbi:alpha/beta hydrolase [Streptomyces sp. NPDC047315]|uniref:alpha/beta hydrolase n=1 Tax=Streptomyces sp. NPDC047315 TaxID=3155142 RepID=UPI0033E48F72
MKNTTSAAALALTLATVMTTAGHTAVASPSSGGDGLERFRKQSVKWTECQDPSLARSGTECARVTVPLDYGKPEGRTLAVAISRIKATDPEKRRGILQSNPGGPGGRGLSLPAEIKAKMTPEVAAAYDVIGMDTRGLGESTPVDCGLTRGMWLHAPGPDRAGFDESVRLSREDARTCWDKYPDVLPHLSTRNIARDVDVVRSALGERKTSWFGQSYGTVLGAVYAQMFPHRIDRLVLDSAPGPADYHSFAMVQKMGPANEEALDDFARWAAPRDREYGLGTTAATVRATVEGLIRSAGTEPIRVGAHRVTQHDLPLVLFSLITDDTGNADVARALRVLLDAAAGKPITVPPALKQFLDMMFDARGTGRAADYAAQLGVLCADAVMPRDPEYYWKAVERSRTSQPVFGPVTNVPLPCAFWKEKPREQPTEINNKVPALQIQATGDTRTTYESGLRMHRAMRGSKLVTVPARSHAVYLYYPNDCVNETVNDYLLDGTLPARNTVCAS